MGQRLSELGADLEAPWPPSSPRSTPSPSAPSPATGWGVVKAYVGDGIVRDFYSEMATHLDPPREALVAQMLGQAGGAEAIVHEVRESHRR
ncbi:MAG: hypothetical protein IPI13_00465 [Actinomycetales bacterium]|uniref:Ferritin-like domain-containing protein n=1 Tax=Candidatus Phosphoribacter hodrii TaxID=2953743 RepID=A0A935M8F8_9MICO|nr:hypothetical protein [Candidatus Phosphoribacter hodrii]